MSFGNNRGNQPKFAYVISVSCVLLVTISLRVNGFEHKSLSFSGNREKRQQQEQQFLLDDLFQINVAELPSSSQVDFSFDPGVVNGNGAMNLQDGGIQRQPQFQQLSRVFSNLIEAAAVQQIPTPQQIVKTTMNSGLKR